MTWFKATLPNTTSYIVIEASCIEEAAAILHKSFKDIYVRWEELKEKQLGMDDVTDAP